MSEIILRSCAAREKLNGKISEAYQNLINRLLKKIVMAYCV